MCKVREMTMNYGARYAILLSLSNLPDDDDDIVVYCWVIH